MNTLMNFFQKVYTLTRQIPEGKVTTYGELAKALGTRDARRVGHLPRVDELSRVKAGAHHARTVGWALHANKDHTTPCHRVVTQDGQLSESYAFGDSLEQYAKLNAEGVTFLDRTHVDLSKHLFRYS